MDTRVVLLAEVLEEMTETTGRLVASAREKRTRLVAVDVPGIDRAVRAEIASAERLHGLDERRIRVLREAGLDGLGADEVVAIADGEERERLASARRALRTQVQELARINEGNRFLSASSIRVIDAALGSLAGSRDESRSYGARGPSAQVRSVLIDRRA